MAFMSREYKFETSTAMNKTDQHTMAMRSLKKLVKPLMRLVKKTQLHKKTLAEVQQNTYNSSLEDMRKDPVAINAAEDNIANEALEERLHNEIRQCRDKAAIIVLQGQQQHVLGIHQHPNYVPVHFVRTSGGTFFWTSLVVNSEQEMHFRSRFDRWAQA